MRPHPLLTQIGSHSLTRRVRPDIVLLLANEFEDVALIGGGSGITPLYQLVNHALKDPTNRTRFTLLYANVSEADILLREELAALQRAHPATFRVVHSLDSPPAGGWSGAKGHVSRELVRAHVPPAEKGDKLKVLICGTYIPSYTYAYAGLDHLTLTTLVRPFFRC